VLQTYVQQNEHMPWHKKICSNITWTSSCLLPKWKRDSKLLKKCLIIAVAPLCFHFFPFSAFLPVGLSALGWLSLFALFPSLDVLCAHYRNRALCRVSEALGKAWKTLSKAFAECDTRQKDLNKQYIGNNFFAEYFLSDTRPGTRQRKAAVTTPGNRDGVFAECSKWHSAKKLLLPSVYQPALGKGSTSTMCRNLSELHMKS
jgi:hypothetical protein